MSIEDPVEETGRETIFWQVVYADVTVTWCMGGGDDSGDDGVELLDGIEDGDANGDASAFSPHERRGNGVAGTAEAEVAIVTEVGAKAVGNGTDADRATDRLDPTG